MKNDDNLRKCLRYKSQHRGTREMDFILGGFAQQHLQYMNYEELLQFEGLLDLPDQELYNWLFKKAPIPESVPVRLAMMIDEYLKNT